MLEWINEETGGCANNGDSGTETTTTGNPCQDKWKESKCKKLKKKGKCGKSKRVKKNCQKTCDMCYNEQEAQDPQENKGTSLAPDSVHSSPDF